MAEAIGDGLRLEAIAADIAVLDRDIGPTATRSPNASSPRRTGLDWRWLLRAVIAVLVYGIANAETGV